MFREIRNNNMIAERNLVNPGFDPDRRVWTDDIIVEEEEEEEEIRRNTEEIKNKKFDPDKRVNWD